MSFGQGPRRGRRRGDFGRGMWRGMRGQSSSNEKTYSSWSPPVNEPSPCVQELGEPTHPPKPISKKEELEMLKQQSQILKHQLDTILNHIEELNQKTEKESVKPIKLKAFIDESRCTGCGICINICPQGAIKMDNIARVNELRCTGCGICINICPNKAIFLKHK